MILKESEKISAADLLCGQFQGISLAFEGCEESLFECCLFQFLIVTYEIAEILAWGAVLTGLHLLIHVGLERIGKRNVKRGDHGHRMADRLFRFKW